MDTKVYYVGFYDVPDSKYQRNCALPATNKMNYIASAIVRTGAVVEIISSSSLIEKKYQFIKGARKRIDHNIYLSTFPSFGSKTKLGEYLKIIFTLSLLFLKLLSVKKYQTVLVYHSPWLSLPVRLSKKIKGFKLILELEEIYADIISLGKVFDKMEYALIDSADAYLLSTDLLRKKVSEQKNSIVIYGKYLVEPAAVITDSKDKIILLYAGLIDPRQPDAFNALHAAKYLDERYELRIIGFGKIEKLIEEIEILNKTNKCKAHYDGILTGEQYTRYCQSCHIGLATREMKGKYLVSSFPSKILSYLSMGLNVVSARIKCVELSKIGPVVSYYDKDSPQSIAEAIQRIHLIPSEDIRKEIEKLDRDFVLSLSDLINYN